MSRPNKQIGWSDKENLLYEVSKKIDRLIQLYCDCSTTTPTTTLPTTTTTTTTTLRPPDYIVLCGVTDEFRGGEAFPTIAEITLGTDTGLVALDYETYNIPDRIVVYFDGVAVIDTGYRGDDSYLAALNAELTLRGESTVPALSGEGTGNDGFMKLTATTQAYVYVYGPLENTAWTFTLFCPNND
jgi:hypothetical protein